MGDPGAVVTIQREDFLSPGFLGCDGVVKIMHPSATDPLSPRLFQGEQNFRGGYFNEVGAVRKGGDKFGGIVGIHTRHGIAGEGGKGLRQRMRPGQFEAGRPAIMGISASSNEGGHPPEDAFDGTNETRWCADDSSVPQWLQADLGTNLTVTGVNLTWEHPAGH